MDKMRSDVIGSLLRPEYLKKAIQRVEAGELEDTEFKQIEDRAVDEALELQLRSGTDVVTDGEMRRYAFFGHFVNSVEGFDKLGGKQITYRNESGEEHTYARPVVVESLKPQRHLCAEEFTYLRARLGKSEKTIKSTIINAQQAASYYEPEKSRDAYRSVDAYMADVVDILRREVEELIRLGCKYIQVDAPQYAALLDPGVRRMYQDRGIDPDRAIDMCIERDNAIVKGLSGAVFGIHLCRGNNQSKFYASGGYEFIARKLFRNIQFDRFLLEYDDKRSGGFEPLKEIPEDRTAVLGLVTTKTGILEDADDLKNRIAEAERYIPRERLALSTQCGFASVIEGNMLTVEEEESKLRLIAETAKEVWG